MATLKIKYPTLITSVLSSHHEQCISLRQDIIREIEGYNNLAADQKLRIPFRGKSKFKVIKHINYDLCNIGQQQSIIICVEEYREGFDDLYLQKDQNPEVFINPSDRIGSSKNFALLYPVIEQCNNSWTNKWIIVIYDTPNKDDADIINTIKYTVNKIFKLPFKFALPNALNGINVIPEIEVSFATLENEENEHIAVHDKVVCATVKTTHSIRYANVTTDEAQEIINDNASLIEGIKRKIKIFKDPNNRATTDTITQELDDDGNLQSTFVSKYGYAHNLDVHDLPDINNITTMVRNFNEVITNYLTNGNV
jgi:hypothetical protein